MTSPILSPTEHWEQATLIQALKCYWTRYPDLSLIHAIPNAGKRNRAARGRLKAEGMTAGVPDLCLPVPRRPYHGMYIELKRLPYTSPKTGNLVRPRPSKEQKRYIAALQAQGYQVVIPSGWAEALQDILCYIKLPRWSE